jgi:hypothetical protein
MKKIFLDDTCFSHCIYSNNPMPPIQFSDNIEWDRSLQFNENDFVIYTDNQIKNFRKNSNKNIAWLIEPKELQSHNYDYLISNHSNFFKIFTHDQELLSLENSILILYGGCWIKKEDFAIYDKTKKVSIVCSNKNFLSGHIFRHECINRFSEKIDVFGNGYNPIDSKLTALKDYKFHIVVENVKKDFWFTEKLIDAFVTGCIPIYYGCPSIGNFFDINGILTFDSLEELEEILNSLTDDLYYSKMEFIVKNFTIAQEYNLAENHISKFLNNC